MAEAKTPKIYAALNAVMKKVDYIQNEYKPGMSYRIVSHDAVTHKVRPHLVEAGIIYYPCKTEYVQQGNRTEMLVTVRFVQIEDGSSIDVQVLGFGVGNDDKSPGKGMSYAVKYALLKALGLETGEDADLQPSKFEEKDPAVETPKEPVNMPGRVGPLTVADLYVDADHDVQVIRSSTGKEFANMSNTDLEKGKAYTVRIHEESILEVLA